MGGRIAFITGRLVVAAFCLLTATYCLLAYIPFTYHQVCLGGLFPWFSAFARWQPWLYWVAFATAVSTVPGLRNDRTRSHTMVFVAVCAGVGLRLATHPLLVRLANEPADLAWCVIVVLPLVWLAWLDWRAQLVQFASAEAPSTVRLFRACVFAAVSLWLVTSGSAAARDPLTGTQLAVVLLSSLISLLAVSLAAFLLLNVGATLAPRCRPPLLRVALQLAPVVALAALVVRFVIFAPLSFSGAAADLVAIAIAFSLVAFAFAGSVRLHDSRQGATDDPLRLLLHPFSLLRHASRPALVAGFVAAGAIVAYTLLLTAKFDWAYLMQTLVVVGAWGAAFGLFYVRANAVRRRHTDVVVIGAAAFVCLCTAVVGLQARQERVPGEMRANFSAALDQYGDYQPGFRLARAALTPPMASPADSSFYEFLAENTNLPRSVRTDPVEINLAGQLAPTAGPKPNIFIFVIDSLRRDYVSVYNPRVNFTPAIEQFARESVIFQNAFTRYAGTGLSEPSIWAGSLLPHKQYVTPFYPMNALQKLLDAEGYHQFITRDEILRTILAPSPAIEELDAGRPTMNCELCQSLAELRSKLQEHPAASRPIFAYTQPQNIHVSVINREGRSVLDGQAYPGFDAPYASRTRALDKCFGEFIAFLRSSGLYDNSIVILTSDHGDSLGERGRWGHAYNVVPEVVRVPLLIHLPTSAAALVSNRTSPSFLVDITPSLYYLLGHRPIERNQIFGKPLFTNTAEEASAYARDHYLIASSYGPVYATLTNGGHSLFVADGVEYKDHFYDLLDGEISGATGVQFHQTIRYALTAIQYFYGLNAPRLTP